MSRQLYLSPNLKPRTEHGGEIRKGKRKQARPFDPKRPVHLVIRSSKAKGKLSLLMRGRAIERLTNSLAQRHRVKLHRYANAGNHLHLIVQAKRRPDFQNFLRNLTGKIAQLITGAKRGNAFGKFWDQLAYTRVAEWGRAFRNLVNYLKLNELEAMGLPVPEGPKCENSGLCENSFLPD